MQQNKLYVVSVGKLFQSLTEVAICLIQWFFIQFPGNNKYWWSTWSAPSV